MVLKSAPFENYPIGSFTVAIGIPQAFNEKKLVGI